MKGERALQQRFCLSEAPLDQIKLRKIRTRRCNISLRTAPVPLSALSENRKLFCKNRKGASVERLGLAVAAQVLVQLGKPRHLDPSIIFFRAKQFFTNGQRALSQRQRVGRPPRLPV